MNKKLINNGVLAGTIVTLLFLGPIVVTPDNYMDPNNFAMGEVIGYSIMVLSMLPVYFGTRSYRNKFVKGEFTFGKGFISALKITVFATVVFYIGNVLVYEVLAPDFLGEFGKHYKEYLLESATDEAMRDKMAEDFESQAALLGNSYAYAGIMASSILMIGVVISLISGLVLRRPAP